MSGWLLSLPCTRAEAAAMSGEVPALDALDDAPVVVTHEVDEAAARWQLDCYFTARPDAAVVAMVQSLVPSAQGAAPALARFADQDWVTLSQQGLAPTQAGRFYVHTPDNRGAPPAAAVCFQIPAGLAFGTGGHATTSGCLAMLDALARRGRRFRNIADIGTGTGLLAFAAQHLWPGARLTASDIDPASIAVAADNAAANGVLLGTAPGRLCLRVAAGTNDPRVQRRAPFDLIIANILAGPLMTLAPDFAAASAPGGHVLLAGLIADQRAAVLAAYRAQRFRLVASSRTGDWPCLLLARRADHGWRRPRRARHRVHAADASFGSW